MQLTVVRKRDGDWHGEALMNARTLAMERQKFLDDHPHAGGSRPIAFVPDNLQLMPYLTAACPDIDLTAAVIVPWHDPLRVAEQAAAPNGTKPQR
jgi:alkanesulfonate monooxygenase SsuD/methylene tetrahydromethanopterin reductase-like flavin-dependent oxidoreductase (luciferase family)